MPPPRPALLAFAAGLALAPATSRAEAPPASEKPNILFIVSDDAGYADFGFTGSKEIKTPNLDRLAAEGLRCTQGYVAGPVCSPSRAGLLTGKQPAHIGHENNLSNHDMGVDTGSPLLPARLKALGYHTGALGKWHLGWAEEYYPWKRGFDEFYGFLGGGSNYLPGAKGIPMTRNGAKDTEKEYMTDALGREACDYISRNEKSPWFLYLAFNAVHSPMQAPEGGEAKQTAISDKSRRTIAAMTVSLDDAVGRVLKTLDTTGQASRTLVVFLNDNGGATYSKFYNAPLRGHKGTLFEGGIRVPFLVRWPGKIPAGKDYTSPITALDLTPVSLAAGGAKPEAWKDSDGENLLPALTGQKPAPAKRELFWRFNVVAAMRDGDWKLIRIRDNAPLLFNLADDLAEKNNVADKEPARVKTMLARLADWEKPFPAPKWTEGPGWESTHVKDHTKPPVYRGLVNNEIVTQE